MTRYQSNAFLVLSILTIATGYAAWKFSDSSRPEVANKADSACEVRFEKGVNAVILRLDDVQAYHLTDVSLRMMRDALSRNLPIVAGVIAKGVSGDQELTGFLRDNRCLVEVAVHGLDHQPVMLEGVERGEFAFLNERETRERLQQALAELGSATQKQPVTFIPPYNEISADSQNALAALGLPIVSGLGSGTYDFDSGTWDFAEARFVSVAEVVGNCLVRFANNDSLCVVMLHPQDYINTDGTVDESRYAEYIKLLNELTNRDGVQVTRFDWHYESMHSN